MNLTTGSDFKKKAFRFVLIFGIVNLFADMTYEGARGISGPFLASLGASAAVVGLVAGLGELLGYGLRSMSGYLADRTHRYWVLIFIGYFVNMMAVPALALAGNWPVAAVLLVAERTGRAIRRPSVEALISHAGRSIGQGWVFGLNEALDQAGATAGPLITALVLYLHAGYHRAFAWLLVPALSCLTVLVTARMLHARPHEMQERRPHSLRANAFAETYWIYVAAGAFIAAGFADFSLIAFHFHKTGAVAQDLVPVYYALAMATGAIASLAIGRLLDRGGLSAVLIALSLSVFSAPLVFFGDSPLILIGVILWGLGLGVQDSALKALLAGVVPPQKRGTGFGVFDTAFGISWFLGSVTMGLLYGRSITALVVLSILLQLGALPLLWLARLRANG